MLFILFNDSSNATAASANFRQVQENAQTLFALFDGKARAFNKQMDQAFEALYHDDFVHSMNDQPLNKAQWKERMMAFAETGTKIVLSKFEPYDDTHFQSSISVINENVDVVGHSRGTVCGSSLLMIEPHDDSKSSYASLPEKKVANLDEHAQVPISQ